MKRMTMLIAALALVAAACGGGDGGCSGIIDDSIDLFQDAINELEGLTLADLSESDTDPFSSADFERRSAELEERVEEAGCTDEDLSELLADRVDDLDAGDNNPAGQLLVSFLQQTAEEGEFTVDFDG